MLYQSVTNPFEKSAFRKSFDLEYRKQKCLSMSKHKKEDHFCCIVIEYTLGVKYYRDYELMCVDGRYNLKILQEFLLKKFKKSPLRQQMMFQVKGKIINPGENIGLLSEKYRDQDGFLYIFINTQNSF